MLWWGSKVQLWNYVAQQNQLISYNPGATTVRSCNQVSDAPACGTAYIASTAYRKLSGWQRVGGWLGPSHCHQRAAPEVHNIVARTGQGPRVSLACFCMRPMMLLTCKLLSSVKLKCSGVASKALAAWHEISSPPPFPLKTQLRPSFALCVGTSATRRNLRAFCTAQILSTSRHRLLLNAICIIMIDVTGGQRENLLNVLYMTIREY